jgi:hypothetical protein
MLTELLRTALSSVIGAASGLVAVLLVKALMGDDDNGCGA